MLPLTARTVGELVDILRKLPQDMPVKTDLADSGCHTHIAVEMQDEWTEYETYVDKKETHILLTSTMEKL